MSNGIRNELLQLLSLIKDTDNKDFHLSMLLERFEDDIKTQLSEINFKKQQLEDNLKTLEYVKKELEVK